MFLERLITLRDTYTLNYSNAVIYSELLPLADLPYPFDYENKYWWRYYCNIYGFYYSRIHCNYVGWLTNGLKKNIGVYLPLFMKTPHKGSKSVGRWKAKSFLYENSLANISNDEFVNFKVNLGTYDYFKATSGSKFSKLAGNREHYAHGSEGFSAYDHDSLVSGYNAKWHDLSNFSGGFYRLIGLTPSRFLVCVNSFYHKAGFFINLFDSQITIYSDLYLNYVYQKQKNILEKGYSMITGISNFFEFKFTKLYNVLLLNMLGLFFNYFKDKLIDYKNLCVKRQYNLKSFKLFNFFIFQKGFFYYRNFFIKSNTPIFFCFKSINRKYTVFWLRGFMKKYKTEFFYKSSLSYKVNNYLGKFFNLFSPRIYELKNYKRAKFKKVQRQSFYYMNVFRWFWGLRLILILRNASFFSYMKKNFRQKMQKCMLFFSIEKSYSSIVSLQKYALDLKRITRYGKLFMKIPSKILRYKFGYKKGVSYMYRKGVLRNFAVIIYKKRIIEMIGNFNKGFFFLILLLIKANFGYTNIFRWNNFFVNYKILDKKLVFKFSYILLEHLSFLKKLLKYPKKLFKSSNKFFIKVFFSFFYSKINCRLKNKLKKIFLKKIRYMDYSFKSIKLNKKKI